MSYADLKGKTFVVTGAASGMGLAVALLLAEQGANVGLLDIRKPDAVLVQIESGGRGKGLALECNVDDCKAVDSAIGQVKAHFGRLDGAANMAGRFGNNTLTGKTHAIEVVSDKDWDELMTTNLSGMKNCLRAELRNMEGSGAIVNAASISGLYGQAYKGPYCVTKFGAIALTQAAAHEVGRRGIRVNAVAPGIIDTPLARAAGSMEDMEAGLSSRTALGRIGKAEEVARVILFLLSDQSSYVTATILNVDAGYY